MYTKLVLAALTTFMMACGGSSGNNEGGSESTACVFTQSGATASCSEELHIDSTTKGVENTGCTESTGTVASSCPTTGLDGCCTLSNTSNGIQTKTCYYSNDAADEKTACTNSANGTWSTSP